MHEVLHRKIRIRDQGRIRDVPTIEAMILKFAERALGGDTKAATFLLNWFVDVEAKGKHLEPSREITSDMTVQEAADAWAATLREFPPPKTRY